MDGFGTPLSEVCCGIVGEEDTVQYRVIVKALADHPYGKPASEKMRMAVARKEQGNILLALNATAPAMSKYNDAFRLIEYEDTDNPEEFLNPETLEMETVHTKTLDELLALKAALHLNMATVFQRMGHAKEGIAKCTQAITVQPSLAKAFYRRSVLRLELDDTHSALQDIMHAKKLAPQSAAITRQLANVQDRIHLNKEREKATWGSMFLPPAT